MKKKAVRLSVVAVLLVAVVAVFVAVTRSSGKKDGDEKEKKPQAVSQTEVADIKGISYSSEATDWETISLLRDESTDVWYYEDDPDFPLSQNYVTKGMVLSAAQATAERTLDETVEDLSEYGLDKPVVNITLTKITGDEVVMHIGDYNDSVEGYYLQVEGDDKLYLVDGKMVFAFSESIYDIADIEDYPLVEESSFTHVKIQNKEQTFEFKGEIEEDAPKYISNNSYMEQDKTWSVSKNGSAYRQGDQEVLKQFIQTLSGLDFSSMAEYRADEKIKESYGLGADAVVLTVDYEVLDETTARQVQVGDGINEIVCDTIDKQYVLLIGNEKPGDSFHDPAYYVCLQGSEIVYTIDAESLSYVMNAGQLMK